MSVKIKGFCFLFVRKVWYWVVILVEMDVMFYWFGMVFFLGVGLVVVVVVGCCVLEVFIVVIVVVGLVLLEGCDFLVVGVVFVVLVVFFLRGIVILLDLYIGVWWSFGLIRKFGELNCCVKWWVWKKDKFYVKRRLLMRCVENWWWCFCVGLNIGIKEVLFIIFYFESVFIL